MVELFEGRERLKATVLNRVALDYVSQDHASFAWEVELADEMIDDALSRLLRENRAALISFDDLEKILVLAGIGASESDPPEEVIGVLRRARKQLEEE